MIKTMDRGLRVTNWVLYSLAENTQNALSFVSSSPKVWALWVTVRDYND